jgi:hypothetical protein
MSRGWKSRWAEARAQGEAAVQELRGELDFIRAKAAQRNVEQDRAVAASTTSCVNCGWAIPSLERRTCPPCVRRALEAR